MQEIVRRVSLKGFIEIMPVIEAYKIWNEIDVEYYPQDGTLKIKAEIMTEELEEIINNLEAFNGRPECN